MGNVYGPYDEDDWYTMKMLKDNLANMRQDYNRFSIAIEKQSRTLKKFLTREAA